MSEITPTVGRVLLFCPKDPTRRDPESRHAAQIAKVNEDGTVNIGVLNDYGVHENEQNITIVGFDETPKPGQAEWMLYQKGQSARNEELEEKLVEAAGQNNVTDITGPPQVDVAEQPEQGVPNEITVDEIEQIAVEVRDAMSEYKTSIGQAVLPQTDESLAIYVKGVSAILEGVVKVTAEMLHDMWLESKLHNGWAYGDVRNNETKTHPNIVAFADLDPAEQEKGNVVIRAVHEHFGAQSEGPAEADTA